MAELNLDFEYLDGIFEMGFKEEFDHLVIPYSMCCTDKIIQNNEVAPGDDVFITGLFRHHHGNNKNIPIVRCGNIASFNEEKVLTKEGAIDAYLIEARSIGGLSGSPVFLNLGITRYIDNKIQQSKSGPIIYLMGLMHGHYDINEADVDKVEEDDSEAINIAKVNTGIGIVVPIHIILSVIKKYENKKII